MPSRIARSKAGYDHAPIPVSTSGVMLVLWMMPNGVSRGRPPVLMVPPFASVWQTAQSPSAASCPPRAMVASE
jgi:hypothetical protein